MIPVIRLPERRVTEAHDGLQVMEIHLLFPADAPPGGLVRFRHLDGHVTRGERTVVLVAKDFEGQETLALLAFVNAILAARQESHADSRVEITTPPTPTPPVIPERPLAGLG